MVCNYCHGKGVQLEVDANIIVVVCSHHRTKQRENAYPLMHMDDNGNIVEGMSDAVMKRYQQECKRYPFPTPHRRYMGLGQTKGRK